MFSIVKFGPWKPSKNISYILICAGEEDEKRLGAGKVLSIFTVFIGRRLNSSEEFIIVQYIERTKLVDSVDTELGFIVLPYSLDNKTDQTLSSRAKEVRQYSLEIGEWLGIEPFSGNLVTKNASILPRLCRGVLLFPACAVDRHNFYVNRFCSSPT